MGQEAGRGGYEIAKIMRDHLGEYRKKYRMSYEQTRAANEIMKCRTGALGGKIVACDQCGKWELRFHSCKNRHCPKCGAYEKAQWLERQKVWLLPVGYYQVVFTIDHVFNRLVWRNQKAMYDLVIRVAVEILKEYGRRYLGGEMGFSLVLHTWGQQMQRHVHVHFMVTGGALVKTAKGCYRWQAAKKAYLFPVKLMSAEYREKFREGVMKLWEDGKLKTEGLDVGEMLEKSGEQDWEVYIQPPVGEPEKLLDYLGRYMHRIAMSNHRIVGYDGENVTYEYYDNRDEGKQKRKTEKGEKFIGDFLMHVLPRRYVRVRHYGLHHGSCRWKLKEARKVLGLPGEIPEVEKLGLLEWLKEILGSETEPDRCPYCGDGRLVVVREIGPIEEWRIKVARVLGMYTRWRMAIEI